EPRDTEAPRLVRRPALPPKTVTDDLLRSVGLGLLASCLFLVPLLNGDDRGLHLLADAGGELIDERGDNVGNVMGLDAVVQRQAVAGSTTKVWKITPTVHESRVSVRKTQNHPNPGSHR